MITIKFSLLKQFSLLILVLVTLVHLIFDLFTPIGFLFPQSVLGLAVLVFSRLEIDEQLKRSDSSLQRYFYFTNGMFAKKAIWVGCLLIAAFVLYNSSSSFSKLTFVAGILIGSEALSLVWRFKRKAYCVILYANYIYLLQTSERKIFAANIGLIEFRYDIFYLTLKDNSVEMLELENFLPEQRGKFKNEFIEWSMRNKISFTNEAKEKLDIS